MTLRAQYFVSAAASVAILAAVTVARAETWTLELKRLESQRRAGSDYAYRATSPQHFFLQLGPQGKNVARMGDQEHSAAFKRIVKKEPKYQSEYPFRGVAKLGSQEFVFALDTASPTPAAKDEKPDSEKAKTEDTQPKADSALAKLADQLLKATVPTETLAPSAIGYNRLHFDFNHNGDLTDDKIVEAEASQGMRPMMVARQQSHFRFQFPQIDVTIDAEGTKLDYSFFLRGQVMVSRELNYASISLNAAAYREGDVTLEGKKRHVVLIDFNSNGRFDDETKIRKDVYTPDGQLYPEQGDMLLVDPDSRNPGLDSPYDVTAGKSRYFVSKLANIDGRFYDVKVSPAGDQLSLTASSVSLGSVTNPNDGFRAVIYGDKGFLKISADKAGPIPVPEGEWKLLSYTIDKTGVKEEPSKPAEKNDDRKGGSLLEALAKNLEAVLGGSALPGARYRQTVVSAQATTQYKAVNVSKAETVELPFGPPYKPVVKGDYYQDGNQRKQLSLGMSLVGSAGEVCTNMMVDGGRPPKPEFTITDAKGKVAQQGSFEYG